LVASLRANPAALSNVARDVLSDAHDAHRDGRLGFLVGAGLSMPIGLPGWNAFNSALVEQSFERNSPAGARPQAGLVRAYLDLLQGQSLAAVDFLRRRAGADFHVVLRGALYERAELRDYAPTEVHHALCKLALEAEPAYPCLHTTNYDDLLELALTVASGQEAQPVHVGRRLVADGPRVVHLHGYFPFEPPAASSQKAKLARELVLSDLDYSRLSNDHSAWTNRELLSLLDSRSVLIVGMSLTDPNVRRLFAYLSDRRRDDGPQHFVVLQRRSPESNLPEAIEAARILDDDEHDFWKTRGVKILQLGSWDQLNYILRRIRFGDAHWDRRHKEVRVGWALEHYPTVSFDDPGVQELGSQALEQARDQLALDLGLRGHVELNLFLPLINGSYRRAFSSMAGRATLAPRPFLPQHDKLSIPEVDQALILGRPVYRRLDSVPDAPPGQPPFQTWYRSIISVPTFDEVAGGVPMAVVQICSSDTDVLDEKTVKSAQLQRYLIEVVRQMIALLGDRPAPRQKLSRKRTGAGRASGS